MKGKKYYVIWEGRETGIYNNWEECKSNIEGFKGAKYKSFKNFEEAQKAFQKDYSEFFKKTNCDINEDVIPEEVEENSLCVDAACSGNPGKMEYQGVFTLGKYQLFHLGPIIGTNNIGEFLAIVHGLAYIKQQGNKIPIIYSDSKIAINWVQKKRCKTLLKKNVETSQAHELILRAEKWLKNNSYTTEIRKWETKKWGEIPADFGRK